MDEKAVNKSQQMQKDLADERIRDRGDNFKKQDGLKNNFSDGVNPKLTRKLPLPDQGDVSLINKVTKIPKAISNDHRIDKLANDISKKHNEIKSKLTENVSYKVNTATEKMSHNKTSEMNNVAVNKTKIGEKHVSDKVSPRPKASNNQNQSRDTNKHALRSDLRTDRLKNQLSFKSVSKEIISDSTKTGSTKTESDVIKKEKDMTAHRKPMIKTVKSKNDNRVYKAVTFTEQKRTKPTILEINIPNTQPKKIKSKVIDKDLEVKLTSVQATGNRSISKLSTKAKSQYNNRNRVTEQRLKRKKLNRCISSPDKFKKVDSPPTEVAKWAPSCLNTHTKPYYEAWVNTTLAAISKISRKDKLFLEKQNIIKAFEKSLEHGTESPNLVHQDYKNECYTGKIKIKQKNLTKKSRQPLITPLMDIDKK